MSALEVLRPGTQSLLQDAGRRGWQHLGLSPAGPLDLHAAAWANHLLGNPWGTPLLEVCMGDLQLRAELDTWVAVCGADLPIERDGEPLRNWSRFPLHAGQTLRLGFARSGVRAYLAVAGGFVTQPVLGSVACQLREGLGGLDGCGQALRAGDRLRCKAAVLTGTASVPWPYVPDYRCPALLRVIVGGDAVEFVEDELQGFFERDWQVAEADRMGVRLLGEPMQAPRRQWSQGVADGAIQLPPDGQPIILMADRQTMGGYPLIGWLHPLDHARLAQCPTRHRLRFTPVSLGDAQAELREFYHFFGKP
ncbi:5-oxoprolinase subunit C family protein [Pseudomonas mangrovi]|uniref:5-oxoprolinase subunit C family protein n=1 Tax=Pseudomonas mangrovi TaxID=2161748 RepID=UPI0015AA0429|nr:biotin-dependent carboxyltransferase family protein [Pseudomonas mangrovi]